MPTFTAKFAREDVRNLRERLLGNKRGVSTAFKLAIAEGIWYWKLHFAPMKFGSPGFTRRRYGGMHPRAGYNIQKPHGEGVRGSQGKAVVEKFRQATGRTTFSAKELRQFHAGHPVDKSTMVYSGLTRAGVLGSGFRTRGSSTTMRGSWNDGRINYFALNARGGELRQYLLYATDQEWRVIASVIEKAFEHYLAVSERGEDLPSLDDLPIVAKKIA